MRDAIGGLFSLQIILAFILLVNGYLAYSVNYTRAFRVKNGIVNILEQYEGHTEEAKERIAEYVDNMRYQIPAGMLNYCQLNGAEDNSSCQCFASQGYCIKMTAVSGTDPESDEYRGVYYTVVTYVNIDIPVLNRFINLGNFLQVRGETRAIYTMDPQV